MHHRNVVNMSDFAPFRIAYQFNIKKTASQRKMLRNSYQLSIPDCSRRLVTASLFPLVFEKENNAKLT